MSSRAEFLTVLAAAAATPAATRGKPAFDFNKAAFERILSKPAAHKQCFGIKRMDGGSGLFAMNNTIQAYEEYYDERPAATQTVGVLYHGAAILMALSDSFWNDILVPYVKKAGAQEADLAADVHPGKGNPYLHSATKDANDVSVQSLVALGSSFFVCHNAIKGMSKQVAQTLHRPEAAIHRHILDSIVPGCMAVPAGVMALNACQEAKFTYAAD